MFCPYSTSALYFFIVCRKDSSWKAFHTFPIGNSTTWLVPILESNNCPISLYNYINRSAIGKNLIETVPIKKLSYRIPLDYVPSFDHKIIGESNARHSLLTNYLPCRTPFSWVTTSLLPGSIRCGGTRAGHSRVELSLINPRGCPHHPNPPTYWPWYVSSEVVWCLQFELLVIGPSLQVGGIIIH